MRQVQEELRRRNLYFGDIDGQDSPNVANALKRYQARKGFAATGALDAETARSLDLEVERVLPVAAAVLPDVPVLKSDNARALPEPEQQLLAAQAEAALDASPSPAPPAEEPPPLENVSAEQMQSYVRQYLRDSESDDLAAQVKYFAYPVEYFDHGAVAAEFVERDVRRYLQRWPRRKYELLTPPTLTMAGRTGETAVRFTLRFEVEGNGRRAAGRTENFWIVRPEGNGLRIVAIRERRLRE